MIIKKNIDLSFKDSDEIIEYYRSLKIDYPKFFKMDILSKLGFLASEMLLQDSMNRFIEREDVVIIYFNRSSSLYVDMQYQKTIQNNNDYYPSPSLFVYTLPNIVTGEIAIRNKFMGETIFYICENFDFEKMMNTVEDIFIDKTFTQALVGWIEASDNIFEVKMYLIERDDKLGVFHS